MKIKSIGLAILLGMSGALIPSLSQASYDEVCNLRRAVNIAFSILPKKAYGIQATHDPNRRKDYRDPYGNRYIVFTYNYESKYYPVIYRVAQLVTIRANCTVDYQIQTGANLVELLTDRNGPPVDRMAQDLVGGAIQATPTEREISTEISESSDLPACKVKVHRKL
jgi:hypothetical protein